jgi:tetrahydromethanopterin S-methyltransferase subunit F
MTEQDYTQLVNQHAIALAVLNTKVDSISKDVTSIKDNMKRGAWLIVALASAEVIGLAGSNVLSLLHAVFG